MYYDAKADAELVSAPPPTLGGGRCQWPRLEMNVGLSALWDSALEPAGLC